MRAVGRANSEQKERFYLALDRLKSCQRPQIKSITAEEKLKLETDFSYFCREAWKTIFPLIELVWSWHYDLISEYLQLVKARKLRRVIFNVPPRSLKTWQISIFFPCWCWIDDPAHSFLCGSYSRDLSTEHSILRRNLITGAWYQGLWGDKFRLSADRNLTTQFANNKSGQMIATSTGSGAEGRGGDTAILDDPMSSQQALSDVERNSANQWVSNTLFQRLNNPRTAAIILIMQRLHELDTTGYVMEQNPGEWEHVVIPLVAEEKKSYFFPISERTFERPKGDVLQPERFTTKVVEQKQRARLVYAGQYQQRPSPLEGNLIKRSEVRYYGGIDPLTGKADESLPASFDLKLLSVDCAFKDLVTSDYVACLAIGVKGRKRYLLNIVNEHLDASATEMTIRSEREEQKPINAVLVEDKANGPAVIQRLKTNVPGVIEVNPQGGKVGRVFAVAPEWQAGDWYVKRNAAWAEPFIQQITMFPTAAHDDMTDAMSQAGVYLLGMGGMGVYQGSWDEAELGYDGELPLGYGVAEETVIVTGGIGQPRVFLACFDDGATVYVDREYVWESGQKADGQFADDLKDFMDGHNRAGAEGRACDRALVLIPPEYGSFDSELTLRGVWHMEGDAENPEDGLRMTASLMSLRLIKFSRERCPRLMARIPAYTYDPKKEVPDSLCDALRLFTKTRIPDWRIAGRASEKAA